MPVLMLSSIADAADSLFDTSALKVAELVNKPIAPEELLAKVEQLLRAARLRHRVRARLAAAPVPGQGGQETMSGIDHFKVLELRARARARGLRVLLRSTPRRRSTPRSSACSGGLPRRRTATSATSSA